MGTRIASSIFVDLHMKGPETEISLKIRRETLSSVLPVCDLPHYGEPFCLVQTSSSFSPKSVFIASNSHESLPFKTCHPGNGTSSTEIAMILLMNKVGNCFVGWKS